MAAAVILAVAALALRPASDGKGASGLAPTFETFDLTGERVRLIHYRGKVVMLNFWASWCVPCRKEFPLLKQVHGEDVVVLGVVYQDSKRAAAAFMRDQGATWPGLIDPDGEIADAYGVAAKPGLPVTIAIDKRGVLVKRHIGELRKGDLEELIGDARREVTAG
ncbi:MAG TPA: TlpA disulfide reductase family protein [Acidimicrobiales bacterium]|nr:TlpA disulfide reductase family protein [Acidimicrobiales bacterium]